MKILTEAYGDKPEFKAYITNLGKYNEGDLVGEWVQFPIDEDDFNEILKKIGISDEPDADGNYYEEWFVTDYDCDLNGFDWQELGEYPSYDALQEFGELVDGIDDVEAVNNAYEVTGDLKEALDGLDDGDIVFYPGIFSLTEMAEYFIDEIGGVEELDQDTRETYFDYEALGRDERINGGYTTDIPDASAGLYFCDDIDADYTEIGEAWAQKVKMNDEDPDDVDWRTWVDLESLANDVEVKEWAAEYYEGTDMPSDQEELANEYLDEEVEGNSVRIGEVCEDHADLEEIGRELDENTYYVSDADVTAGYFWCGDDNASDEEIGEEIVSQLGFDGIANPEYYFDYEAYGRDLGYDGFTITKDGCIEYR